MCRQCMCHAPIKTRGKRAPIPLIALSSDHSNSRITPLNHSARSLRSITQEYLALFEGTVIVLVEALELALDRVKGARVDLAQP